MTDELFKAYSYTFDTPHGKTVLEDLRDQYVDIARYTPHHTSALDLAFCEGQRWVVMQIYQNIEQGRENKEEEPDTVEHEGGYI